MSDRYYELLVRSAVGALDSTERPAAYERARHALRQQLRAANPEIPDSVLGTQLATFNAAIERFERDLAEGQAYDERAEAEARRQLSRWPSRSRRLLFGVAGLVAVAVIGVLVYVFGPRPGKGSLQFASASASRSPQPERQTATAAGSSAAPLPYVFMRQVVYYRSTHPAGTVVIDKAQRFLYVTRPKVVAVRYGIGVGQECNDAVGLFRVTRKEERPEASGSAGLQSIVMKAWSGQKAGSLGARAMYLDSDIRLIHGTDIPESIGRFGSFGCFRLIDGDVIELYDQIAVGGRVVVN